MLGKYSYTLHVARCTRAWNASSVERVPWNVQRLLSSSPKPRRNAIDGQQQCGQSVLLSRAIAPQQLDLLAVHLVQRGQAAGQALAELGEALGELGAAGEAAQHGDRPMVFVGDEREDLLAQPRIGHQLGIG